MNMNTSGHVKISSGFWAKCTHLYFVSCVDPCDPDGATSIVDEHIINLLGSGNTFVGYLEDYNAEDQALLMTTLPRKPYSQYCCVCAAQMPGPMLHGHMCDKCGTEVAPWDTQTL